MKTKRIILSLLVAIALVFGLTGCFLFNAGDTITMVNAPKTDYVLNDTQALEFTVKVVVGGKDYTLSYAGAETEELKVEGFDLTSTGTRTATITYKKANNLQLTFTYTVTDASATLAGDGSVATPYILTSAADFATLAAKDNFQTANIQLGNDITFTAEISKVYSEALYETNFVGTFDGQGYTISEYTPVGKDGEDGEQAQAGLFYQIAPAAGQTATIKNLKLSNCSITNASAAGAGLLGQGSYANKDAQGDVVIDNVDMFGCKVQSMKNSSLYLGYAAGKNITFKNCDADGNCSVLTTGHSSATFVGSGAYINFAGWAADGKTFITPSDSGLLSFDNCSSAAKLTGSQHVRGFVGNEAMNGKYTAERKNGCKYTGTIYTCNTAENSAATIGGTALIENTSLDNYTIHCAGAATTGTGFTAVKDITNGSLTKGEVGTALSINNVANGATYIFAYSFSRGGSFYGNSFTATSGNGNTEIKWFNTIYDYKDEGYTADLDADALKVYGALRELTDKTYPEATAKVTFSVMVLDAQGNMVAYYSYLDAAVTVNWDMSK